MNKTSNSSNNYKAKAKQETTSNAQAQNATNSSEQDSSRSKYVENTDRRKRQDSPGGN